jgi:hypothetical protein
MAHIIPQLNINKLDPLSNLHHLPHHPIKEININMINMEDKVLDPIIINTEMDKESNTDALKNVVLLQVLLYVVAVSLIV